ncbi:hypothetical protein GOODEAATRI_010563, partial [Goodea atripinnis]
DRHSERHKESRLNPRPPSHSATYATVSAWHHQPEKLILDSCRYEATKSKDSKKGPVVILSITYRGVKFIDAATKDPDDLCTFAYITKDSKSGHHFCHVFSTIQTYEIILTLGQAFEVAYQMAVQSRARQYVPPTSLGSEFIEPKTSRPVSQSWNSMRRSAGAPLLDCRCCHCHTVCDYNLITGLTVPLIHMHMCELRTCQCGANGLHCHTSHTSSSRPSSLPTPLRQIDPLEMDADMQSLGSTTWLCDQRDSNRRPVSTKYETTIF